MALLNKDAIFDIAAQGFKTRDVAVPEWGRGMTVRVRELSEAEFRKVGGEMGATEGAGQVERAMDYTYDVVAWCAQDDNGEPLFEPADVPKLKQAAKTATFYNGLMRLANAVFDLSGLVETGDEDEGAEKN